MEKNQTGGEYPGVSGVTLLSPALSLERRKPEVQPTTVHEKIRGWNQEQEERLVQINPIRVMETDLKDDTQKFDRACGNTLV